MSSGPHPAADSSSSSAALARFSAASPVPRSEIATCLSSASASVAMRTHSSTLAPSSSALEKRCWAPQRPTLPPAARSSPAVFSDPP